MRSLAGMIANQKTANEERGTKFTTTGTTTATAKPEEEVSERTRWNDPADRIVSAYVSLAEGNICVMACESYVTQERTSSPSLSLFSIFLFLSCPFLGTCALFSASLCLPSSHKGYGGHRSPVATGGTSGEPQEENIFFLYPPPIFRSSPWTLWLRSKRGNRRWKFSEPRKECQLVLFFRKRNFFLYMSIKILNLKR